MGQQVGRIGPFLISEKDALNFAMMFDPHPNHVMGIANDLLPAFSVSGLFVMSLVLRALFDTPAYAARLCATSLEVKWKAPIKALDLLMAEYRYEESEDQNRTPRLVRRVTKVDLWKDKTLVASLSVVNLFPSRSPLQAEP